MKNESPAKVAVMATCLADALRPQTVRATCSLVAAIARDRNPPAPLAAPLAALPKRQTCCGQILYNAGDRKGAARQALRVLDLFDPFQAVVVPSGSCAGMLKRHYPKLLADTPHARRAESFAKKCWELTEFLQTHRPQTKKTSASPATPPPSKKSVILTWHDSCSCLRECDSSVESARSLLAAHGFSVREVSVDSSAREVCCGFGGKFSIANSAISTSMADDKLAHLQKSNAKIVASCDLGCLLHLAGRARRRNLPLQFFHIAELLVEQKPLVQNSLAIGA